MMERYTARAVQVHAQWSQAQAHGTLLARLCAGVGCQAPHVTTQAHISFQKTGGSRLRWTHQPSVALANWMPSRMPASIQFWMANSMMMASQIMMGMGPHTAGK